MSSTCTVMYWLAVPPLFGLNAPWAPCAPRPIMPSPNSTIVWSIPPSARTPRAARTSRNPNARSRHESAAPTSSYGTRGTIVGRRIGWTSCRIAAMSTAFPRSSAAGLNAASRRSFLARSTVFIAASPSCPLRLEQFAQVRAGAVESRAHRADRKLERLGHALVREVLPREEQERLALALRQRLDRAGHPREEQPGIEGLGARALVRRLVSRRHPSARAQPAGLAAPGLQQQVRADPVEPRERARARQVERLAVLERDPEQLAAQPLRPSGTYPAAQEAEQGGRVAVVDQAEGLGLVQRAADHLGVRGRTHRLLFPDPGVEFAGQRNDLPRRPCALIPAAVLLYQTPSPHLLYPLLARPLSRYVRLHREHPSRCGTLRTLETPSP